MRLRLGWVVALLLLVGVVGPRLTPTGVSQYAGDQRRSAEEALQMAHMTLENPLERMLLVQSLRVQEVKPLPEGALDHLGTGRCSHEVRVKAYSLFWLPYRDVTVRCGSAGVSR